jgi:hypothetical protein
MPTLWRTQAVTDLDDAVLALEAPLRKLAAMLSRDEVESILDDALEDVYEGDNED